MVQLELEEGERQAVLLALAALSVERPGWDRMLNAIALRIDNDEGGRAQMYDGFRALREPTGLQNVGCCSRDCSEPATHVMHWPGAGRKLVCAKCWKRAVVVAQTMGFELDTESL